MVQEPLRQIGKPGRVKSVLSAARSVKLLLDLLFRLPNILASEIQARSFCKRKCRDSETPNLEEENKSKSFKFYNQGRHVSFHVISAQKTKLKENPAEHQSCSFRSTRLTEFNVDGLLDMTRATVVLPVPGAPVKMKCPNSGISEPSWEPNKPTFKQYTCSAFPTKLSSQIISC